MVFTAQLGTALSMPGNIALGLVIVLPAGPFSATAVDTAVGGAAAVDTQVGAASATDAGVGNAAASDT